jgi:hypothetical protein
LWDRTKDTDIPGHAALYTNEGRGQGLNYIENYLTKYQLAEDRDTFATDEGWDKIKR